MKSLVIAEKPSVARDIARVLHCNQKGNGILEGKEYVVTWALGHLVTLADPEEYDKKYGAEHLNHNIRTDELHKMFVTDKLTLNSGGADLKAVRLLNRIKLIKRTVDCTGNIFAIVNVNAFGLVNVNTQETVCTFLDITHIPK